MFPFSFISPANISNVVEFTPSSISGLKLWLSADSGAYNDAGTTLATNGQSVQQWNDRSSNSQNSSQASSGLRPLFVSSVVNGRPVIRFDGSDDFLSLGQSLTGSTQTFFIVARNNDLTNGSVLLGNNSVSGNRYLFFQLPATGLPGLRYAHFDPDVAHSPTITGSVFAIVSAIQNGTSATAYTNGTAGTTTNTMSTADTNVLDSIGRYTTLIYMMDGDIAEIIYYDVAVSNTDRILIENYLNTKYAVY